MKHASMCPDRADLLNRIALGQWLRAVLCAILLVVTTPRSEAQSGPCHGHFPDLIGDICWICAFPIAIGPAVASLGQSDNGPAAPLLCTCPAPPPLFIREGVGISYWEPARLSEVVRTPWCSPTLGSQLANTLAPGGTNVGKSGQTGKNGFYQVHYFSFPVLSWIGAAFSAVACANDTSFDLLYVSELDPLWSDDALSFLINPEAILFESAPAQAACIADAIAATADWGIDEMFWCSGSQGSVYPFDGTVAEHVGGVDSSMLLTHRMLFKLHRELIAQDTSTTAAMCESQPQPILRKNQYKLAMVYPVPKTDAPTPIGRSTATFVSGREYPYEGEDFSQMIWRKRLCCAF